jgi:type IV secretory pathway TraG/TraD family ATPase VirD4
MFLIDEFPALGHIQELPRDLATMSGYGVDFTLAVQGIDQLKDVYGDAHATILNNCAYKWFCNVSDLQTAEWLSKALGKKTVRTTSTSQSKAAPGAGTTATETESRGETGRDLLTPDEVLNLGRDVAILLAPETRPHYTYVQFNWDGSTHTLDHTNSRDGRGEKAWPQTGFSDPSSAS